MDRNPAMVGGSAPSFGQRLYRQLDQVNRVDAPVISSDIPGQPGRFGANVPMAGNQTLAPVGGVPGVPIPPTGPQTPTADPTGRFSMAGAQAQQGPDQAARAAYLEAQASGKDALVAAREAWKQGVGTLSTRMGAKDYKPTDPGEANLLTTWKHLQQRSQLDPVSALAMAHEFLAQIDTPQPAGPGAGSPQAPPVPPTQPAQPADQALGRFGR